jgi:hypothetical protein
VAKNYGRLVSEISNLLEQSRRSAARSINAVLTATYWEIGRRLVEYEQGGKLRAGYGEELLARLAKDLAVQHGRGFPSAISARWGRSTWAGRFGRHRPPDQHPILAVRSSNPVALLTSGPRRRPEEIPSVEEEIRDPYLLEFLNLKDEYSENELEEALIHHMEWFLLEMGAGFTFVARQKRIRIGDSWYRIDLLLYHRGLRSLVVIDLKTGAFTHADTGQMNLYLNYAKQHLMMPGEGEPVGIILCSDRDDAVAKYSTGGIRAQVFASKYLTNLPDEETLRREILTTQRAIRARWNNEKTDG